MSLELLYIVDDARFSMPLRDMEILNRLKKYHPREVELVFGVDEPDEASFDEPRASVRRLDVLTATDQLLVAFKTHSDLVPLRYVFDFELYGQPYRGDEDVFSFALPGKNGWYELVGGINRCFLKSLEPASEATQGEPQEIDVRHRSSIETVDMGTIQIRTIRKRSPIAADLKKLRTFLASRTEESVEKRLV